MEAWVIAGVVGVVGTALVSLAYYFIVRPSAVADGAAEAQAVAKAKAEGLQVAADELQRMADEAGKVLANQTAERKMLSPVDVANAEIARRLKTLGKKP